MILMVLVLMNLMTMMMNSDDSDDNGLVVVRFTGGKWGRCFPLLSLSMASPPETSHDDEP
jgi:hypothetical protein